MEYIIRKIDESNKEFPNCLRTIPSRPKELYLIGNLDLSAPCVAIVGPRVPSTYGKQVCAEVVRGLAQSGVCIVSGMAPGIDTLAHKTALDCHGQTIAVIGSGLDKKSIYPQQNLDLAQKIVDTGGCLVSEYPVGTKGANWTFPQRNRIVAGLSLAIVVIEAKEKSGSIITGQWGFKQHKLVFAVPGSIYSATSRGCHWLLANGAKPCASAQDILNAIGIAPANKKIIGAQSPEEQKIIDALKENALDIDQIILATELSAQIVISLIPLMELNGLIKNIELNTYAINNC